MDNVLQKLKRDKDRAVDRSRRLAEDLRATARDLRAVCNRLSKHDSLIEFVIRTGRKRVYMTIIDFRARRQHIWRVFPGPTRAGLAIFVLSAIRDQRQEHGVEVAVALPPLATLV
jgi:hypothetical protein